MLVAVWAGVLAPVEPVAAQQADSGWQKVPAVDWSTIRVSDFDDQELDLIYLLEHFHTVANSVVEKGPARGFIDIPVWRKHPKNNRPRAMENTLALAYFYTKDEPWNPYYGTEPVRRRLEAALRYWIGLQKPDGTFRTKRNRYARTAFETKFMGETLQRLAGGPPIDARLHRRVANTERRAIRAVLEEEKDFYSWQKSVTNQYSNVFAGGVAYLDLYPNAALEALLRDKLQDARRDFQSPAGYFYERNGVDYQYNLGTMQSDLQMVWYYARQNERFADLSKILVQMERKFARWLSINAVRRPPGGIGYTLNRGVETRKQLGFLPLQGPAGYEQPLKRDYRTLLAQEVPQARAFLPDSAAIQRQAAMRREELRRQLPDPEVASLHPGRFAAYSPYAFLLREQGRWYPTARQKQAAVHALPYEKYERFTQQRVDDRKDLTFTYVRRPAYYAAFNSGEQRSDQQRYGLGVVWHPQMGAVLQSQTGSEKAAWGTKDDPQSRVTEGYALHPRFQIGEQTITPQPGVRNLPAGDSLTIRYAAGQDLMKTVRFQDQQIVVRVREERREARALVEDLPLLVDDDAYVKLGDGKASLTQGGHTLAIPYGSETGSVQATTVATGEQVGGRRVVTLRLKFTGALAYRLDFAGEPVAKDVRANTAKGFVLLGNHPNPFRERTNIRVRLLKPSRVRVEVYDVLGRNVLDRSTESLTPGWREILLQAGRLASGVYVYRATATAEGSRWARTGKLVIVQ